MRTMNVIPHASLCQLVGTLSVVAVLSACGSIPADVPRLAVGKASLDKTADLQARLDKLASPPASFASAGVSADSAALTQSKYAWAKAQCWVRNAYSEQHESDARGFSDLALAEAQKLISSLENKTAISQDTALINHTEQLRPDLWKQAEGLKQHRGYACAAATVACLEVQLSRSGHELTETGWRHANSYLAIAEDMAQKAKSQAEACKPPPPPPSIVPMPAAPVAPPPPPPAAPKPTAIKSIEKVTLNASALFRFDKRGAADLLPEGRAQLDELAAKIGKVYESVESIELVGHTDRLGSDAYNDKLSLDRANTVKAYLQGKGVSAAMTAQGKGKLEPVVQCPGGNAPTPVLTQCLQPNRRVEITIVGVKK